MLVPGLAGSFVALLVGWLVAVVRGLSVARHIFTLFTLPFITLLHIHCLFLLLYFLYGNYCFDVTMKDAIVIKNCTDMCYSNCEDVRFSINEKEIPIDIDYQCGTEFDQGAEGYYLTTNLLMRYCLQNTGSQIF